MWIILKFFLFLYTIIVIEILGEKMRDNIFKEMIMDSPIAYVSVKGIRDNENKYANLQNNRG